MIYTERKVSIKNDVAMIDSPIILFRGDSSFHIRLFDEDQTSRITIPYVQNGIEIKEPLVIEEEMLPEDVTYERNLTMNNNSIINLTTPNGDIYVVNLDDDGIPVVTQKVE